MERARPASARQRPRRGSVDRPIDIRLVRNVSLVLVAPLMVAALAGWGFVDNWLRSRPSAQNA